jgi:hypothetical protein
VRWHIPERSDGRGEPTRNVPVLLSFTHDGVQTAAAYLNGELAGRGSGPEYAAVGRFGGGHFVIPFWCGNAYHAMREERRTGGGGESLSADAPTTISSV